VIVGELRLDDDAPVVAGFGAEMLKHAVLAIEPFAHRLENSTKIGLVDAHVDPRHPRGPPTRRLHGAEACHLPGLPLGWPEQRQALGFVWSGDKNDAPPPPRTRAASVLLLHYIIGQERQCAGFADRSRPKAVSPESVPIGIAGKAPHMAGYFRTPVAWT
jgi:hypothetical protein